MRGIARGVLVSACAAAALAGLTGTGGTGFASAGASRPVYATVAQPEEGLGAGNDWTAIQGGADDASYSRLTQITPANVSRLKLASYLDLDDEISLEGNPLAVNGILYFPGGSSNVYAVDGVTGKVLWQWQPETWKRKPVRSWAVNRGLAYENGKIFVVEQDGRMSALDAKTGAVIWSAESIPAGLQVHSNGAPRVMNGKVIIGNGGTDGGGRGFVTAFDAATGKFLWRFYVVPGTPEQNAGNPDMEAAAKTWDGDWVKMGGGGSPWNGITYDPEFDRVYVGTGNAGPWDPAKRSPGGNGDNLYVSSIVALDAKTGKLAWHYQETPRDAWDYKATPNIVTATLNIDGKPRKVVMHAPTNGFFYVIDRETGKLVNKPGKTTKITWASDIDMATGRPIETPGARYENGEFDLWPGTIGGHNWQAMSYNPRLGLAYIPVQHMGNRFARSTVNALDGVRARGLPISPLYVDDDDGKGFLLAWDPVRQQEAWRVKHDTFWNGGIMSTASGVVFQGLADGYFDAYDGRSGTRLWHFYAGLGIIGAPMTFSAGGKQYVSILVGYGGTTGPMGKPAVLGWKYGVHKRRLLTFALDARGKMPEMLKPDFVIHAVDDPALQIDPADVAKGRMIAFTCNNCHGGEFAPGTPGPDLRESGIALDLATFGEFLKTGNQARGMPAFPQFNADQVRQLHAFIRDSARRALAAQKTGGGKPSASK